MTFELGHLDSSVFAPGRGAAESHPDHLVEIYEDDELLVANVARFLARSLAADGAAVVLATRDHHVALERMLYEAGHDIEALTDGGRYVSLDANEVLRAISVDGVPKKTLFMEEVGSVIEAASSGGRQVRAFGELVALLVAEGRTAAALRLEELWNELGATYPFSLFCGYPADAFDASTVTSLREVCALHTHVLTPA